MSQSDIDRLVSATREAIILSDKATAAIEKRDLALDGLKSMVGGDRLGAIHNAYKRIGELMVETG